MTSSRPQLMQKFGVFAIACAFRVANASWAASS
jgi:hypothetical protein